MMEQSREAGSAARFRRVTADRARIICNGKCLKHLEIRSILQIPLTCRSLALAADRMNGARPAAATWGPHIIAVTR